MKRNNLLLKCGLKLEADLVQLYSTPRTPALCAT
jgi:hypothetical protein